MKNHFDTKFNDPDNPIKDIIKEQLDFVSELDFMDYEAEKLINQLMSELEDRCPEFYSSSDLILKCDKWLKWANNESDPEELKEFFNYPN